MTNNAKNEYEAIIQKETSDEEEEIQGIKDTLRLIPRRVELGAVVKIDALEILEEEQSCMMKTPYIYGVISNLEEICEYTTSRAYQIEWAYGHIDLGNSFMSLIAPYWEHVFKIVKFEDEDDDKEDNEFTKLFDKVDGKWIGLVPYKCELCDSSKCDRALFNIELDGIIKDLKVVDKSNSEKRLTVYAKFNWEKHGSVEERLISDIDDCVKELTELLFLVETRKRRRGLK